MASHKKHNTNQTKETAQRQRTIRPVGRGPVVQALLPDRLKLQRAVADPGQAAPSDVLALQRAYGNRAVLPLLAQASLPRIQARLTINPVGDRYEQEADRVAAQVMSGHWSVEGRRPAVRRQEKKELQTKPQSMVAGGTVSPQMEKAIQGALGGGQPLTDRVRLPMEQAFGSDLSGVRVHADQVADSLNRSLQARAFTRGQNIFFRSGQYNPGSSAGQQLMAHELTHVVQQGGAGPSRRLQSSREPGVVRELLGDSRTIQLGRRIGEEEFLEIAKIERPKPSKTKRPRLGELKKQMAKQKRQKPSEKKMEKKTAKKVQEYERLIEKAKGLTRPKKTARHKRKPKRKPPKEKSPFQPILPEIASYIASGGGKRTLVWTKTDLEREGGKKSSTEYKNIGKELAACHDMTEDNQEQVEKRDAKTTELQVAIVKWKNKNKRGFVQKIFTQDTKKKMREALTELEKQVIGEGERLDGLYSAFRLQTLCQRAEKLDKGSPPKTEKEVNSAIRGFRTDVIRELPRKPKTLVDMLRQQVENRIAQLEELKVRLETEAQEKELEQPLKELKEEEFHKWVKQQVGIKGFTAKAGETSLAELGHKLEALDPEHRDYNTLNKLFDSWLTEKTKDSFFVWVSKWEETGGKIPRTKYLTKGDERKKYELGFKGIQPYYEKRKEYYQEQGSKKGERSAAKKFKQGIYVMTPAGEFYARREDEKRKREFHHSSFLAGLPVGAAGHMEIQTGKMQIDLESGHYQPRARHMLNAVRGLEKHKVPLKQVKVRPFAKEVFNVWWSAEGFLGELKSLKKTDGRVGGKLAAALTKGGKAGEQVRETYQAF